MNNDNPSGLPPVGPHLPGPGDPPPSTKTFIFRIGVGLSVLGVLLLETGIPGIIIFFVGVISLAFSGFFDKFLPHK